jgi:hypothetical protein
MRKVNPKTKLYQYLEEHNYLKGDIELFNKGKKQYRKLYKREHQREQRRLYKAIRFWNTKEEYKLVKDQARLHKLPVSRFAKEAITNYINKTIIIPDIRTLAKIKQMLHLVNSGFQDKQSLLLTAEREMIFEQIKLTNQLLENVFYVPRILRSKVLNASTMEEAVKELYQIVISKTNYDYKGFTEKIPFKPEESNSVHFE